MSQGSAHEFFGFEDMCNVQIPIPDISIQRSITDICTIYQKCKSIIKSAVEEAQSQSAKETH